MVSKRQMKQKQARTTRQYLRLRKIPHLPHLHLIDETGRVSYRGSVILCKVFAIALSMMKKDERERLSAIADTMALQRLFTCMLGGLRLEKAREELRCHEEREARKRGKVVA